MLKNNEKAFFYAMKGDEFLDIKNTGIREKPLCTKLSAKPTKCLLSNACFAFLNFRKTAHNPVPVFQTARRVLRKI